MTETDWARLKPLDAMPSPKGLPLIGEALDFMGHNPWDVLVRYAREVGPICRMDAVGAHIVVLNDADAIGEVLIDNEAAYWKKNPGPALRPVSTDEGDVFTQPGGAVWKARKAVNPMALALKTDWLDKVAPSLHAVIAERFDSWRGQTLPDTYEALRHLAFDAFSVMLYGQQFPPEGYKQIIELANELSHRMTSPVPVLPILSPTGMIARHGFHKMQVEAVAAARKTPNPTGPDLVREAIRARTNHSDDLLASDISNMYFGGVFSASTAVAATLWLLGRHPAARATVEAALVGLGPNPDAAAIHGCLPLRAAIFEAMRLLPPVALFTRNVATDQPAALAGYLVPAGTTVMICNKYLHQDPKHWEAPEAYRPERWTPEVVAANPLGSGWFFPFGRGQRACLGQAVAMRYIELAVGTALLRTDPQVGIGAEWTEDFWFGCMIPKGLSSTFAARR